MPKAIINGISMYYEVHGKGEPLVLIQGLGGDHQGWFFQVRAFVKHFLVITFDNRGIGKTEQSKEPYTIRTMADDVISLMDYLDIDKAHILGVSLGGMVAQEIAITYPRRVRKLILGSTFATRRMNDIASGLPRNDGVQEDSSNAAMQNLKFETLMKFMVFSAFNRVLYRMFFSIMLRMQRKSVDAEGYLGQMRVISGYDTVDRLHLIQAPTLVITGTGDRLVSSHDSDIIATRIPNAKLVKVDGGSHAFFMEMKGRFNEEVLAFLTRG